MAEKRIFPLLMIAVIVSFCGFCIENIFISLCGGIMNNRNMVLPFLFGYGLSILGFFFVFGTPNEPKLFGKEIAIGSVKKATVYYFFVSFICVSLGELILGHLTQWLCGILWWDYTRLPLHITRYTSVPTSLCFATLITVFMKYFFVSLMNTFSKMKPRSLAMLSLSLTILLSLDMLNSAIYMFKNRDMLRLWNFDANKHIGKAFIRFLSE